MQLVVLVVQVEGNLSTSGYFQADNVSIATPFLLALELVQTFSRSELVRKEL